MLRTRMFPALAAAFPAALLMITTSPAPEAQAAEADFFKGKNVTYIVATGAGGGFDFYGRLVAKYMQENLPGSTFVVRNMPGAGHMIGTNYIYNAKPNGLTMGSFNTAMFLNQIVGKKGVKYDLAKMDFLGKASNSQQVIMVSTKLPYKSIAELRASGKRLKMATGGPGSGRWIFARMSEAAMNLKFRMIPGYDGPDAHLAIMRGEIDVMMGSIESNDPFVAQKRGRYLVFYATERQKEHPDVPSAYELVTDEDGRALARMIVLAGEMWRVTAAPPGLPAGRLKLLRGVYKASLENPKLRKEAKLAGREIVAAYGEDVDKAFQAALNAPPRVRALIKEAVSAKATFARHTGKVTQTKRGGRRIFIMYQGKEVKAKISGSRTKVTINGKPDKRKNVKPGMTCTFVYVRPGAEAKELICKN